MTARRQPNWDAVDAQLARSFPPTGIMSRPLTAGDSSLQWAIDTGKVKIPPPASSPTKAATAGRARRPAARRP